MGEGPRSLKWLSVWAVLPERCQEDRRDALIVPSQADEQGQPWCQTLGSL